MPTLTCHEIDDQLDGYEYAAREHAHRVQAAIDRVERDVSLKQHLDALGMPDAVAYRQWCKRHGLSTRLAKSALARDDELDLMRSVDSWRFKSKEIFSDKDHCQLVRLRRFARRGAWDKTRRATEQTIACLADETVGPDTDARRRFCQLLTGFVLGYPAALYHSDIPAWVGKSLALIARAADRFARDPEDWEPQSRHDFRSALRSFVRFTTVRYETPPRWAERVFFDEYRINLGAVAQYLHLAAGYGLHRATLPFPVARRAARLAVDAPNSCHSIGSALRYGEARTHGASQTRAKAIANSGLSHDDEPFWSTIVQWLSQHDEFPSDEIDSLRRYIYRVRFEDRWRCDHRGRWIVGPADPDWKIAGRSAASLLEDMRKMAILDDGAGERKFNTARPPVPPEHVQVEGQSERWLVVPVTGEDQFVDEGRAMSHCVATYHDDAESGELLIFSLRQIRGQDLKRHVTICVKPCVGVSEARGFANRAPNQKELHAISTWAKRHQIDMKLMEA